MMCSLVDMAPPIYLPKVDFWGVPYIYIYISYRCVLLFKPQLQTAASGNDANDMPCICPVAADANRGTETSAGANTKREAHHIDNALTEAGRKLWKVYYSLRVFIPMYLFMYVCMYIYIYSYSY